MGNLELSVYDVTASILRKLDATKDAPSTRGILSNIRNSVNKDISNNIYVISYVFQNIPEEMMGSMNELNDYEKAIVTAVQMYAIHQQSISKSVLKPDYKEGERRQNIGDALKTLRTGESESTDARFNALITASNFNQLQNNLRQMIKLLKSKSDVEVDYASLADDLYWFLKDQKDGIKMKWARSYYKINKKDSKGDN